MLDKDKGNLDDLIGATPEPIIVQESSSDKKFLYTLLILLVILFIIALALIAFLGSKYFGESKPVVVKESMPKVTKEAKTEAPIEQVASSSKNITATQPKIEVKPQIKAEPKKEDSSINDLEQIVTQEQKPKEKSSVEKTITKVSQESGAKKLTPQEIALIAKLVAKELAKSKAISANKAEQKSSNTNMQTPTSKQSKKSLDDAALVASLQKAQTDTLKEEDINTNSIKQGQNIKAKATNKKVDTFNKVIIEKKAKSDDELSKLSAEIDTILQSEDVKKEEKNLKFKKAFDKEANLRAKEMRFIVVKKGDTLSSIAYRAYGRASAYMKIFKANPDLVKNPNKIYVGMRLRVPVDDEYKANNLGN